MFTCCRTHADLPLQEDDFVDEFREETEKVAAYNVLVDEEEEDDAEEPVEDIVHDRSGEGVSDSEEKEGRKPAAAAAASPRAVEAAMLAAVKKVLPGRQDTVDLREVLNKTKKEEGCVCVCMCVRARVCVCAHVCVCVLHVCACECG